MLSNKSRFFSSVYFPVIFVLLLWAIKLYEFVNNVSFASYGIYPRTSHGLIGIITTPLLHGDFSHLLANSLPLLILGPIIIYFYRDIAFQIFAWIYLMTGLWVWSFARESFHIGASGIVYGFETFLFFSGVFRKDPRLMAISLFVVFLYGSTLWGVLPIMPGVSWESHLLGAIAGLIAAYHFRKEGPPKKTYDFGNDEENETIDVTGTDNSALPEEKTTNPNPIQVNYNFIPKNKEEENL